MLMVYSSPRLHFASNVIIITEKTAATCNWEILSNVHMIFVWSHEECDIIVVSYQVIIPGTLQNLYLPEKGTI
jgi:hypothetical protein